MTTHSNNQTQWQSGNADMLSAKRLIIAVDGPAAAGKGTLAINLAKRLGLGYLDTGALYRAVALAVVEIGGNASDINDVRPALEIVKRNLTPELLNNPAIRTPQVAEAASKVSALPEVRAALLDFQREFTQDPQWAFTVDGTLTTAVEHIGGAVLDGRDIGTVVCPDADMKFFITASAQVRAERRFKELVARDPSVQYEQVLADQLARDERDQTRATAPLRAATGAYVLDTSSLTADEVLEEAMAIIRSRFIADSQI